MHRKYLGRLALTVAVAVGLAACSDDDSPTDPGSDLTPEEAEVMMTALVEAGGFGFEFLPGGGFDGMTWEPIAFNTIDIEDVIQCPQGGSIQLSGSLTFDDEFENLSWQVSQTHQSCQVTASSDGSSWTFNGAPNVTMAWTMSLVGNEIHIDASQAGAIAWEGDFGSGSCSIDLSYGFVGAQDGSSFQGSVQGSVCGHSISETVQL